MSDIITQSRIKTWQECQMKENFIYRMGYQTVFDSEALVMGTMFHGALEILYLENWDVEKAIAFVESHAGKCRAKTWLDCKAMVAGYAVYWENEKLEVEAVEKVFRFKTPEGRQVSGKYDGIVRNDEGTFVLEHKTSSEDIAPGSNYWHRLWLDWQCSIYLQAADHDGYQPLGILYDVAKKPRTRFTSKDTEDRYFGRVLDAISESLPEYFVRERLVKLEFEKEREVVRLSKISEQIMTTRDFIPNPNACFNYGRLCGFHGVCTGTQSLDDGELFRKKEEMHEELKEGEKK